MNKLSRAERLLIDAHTSHSRNFEVTVDRVTQTTSSFRTLSPSLRNCYYPDERKLHYYTRYSEANCALECAWMAAVEVCQCVPWFLQPVFPTLAVCHVIQNQCFKQVLAERYVTESDCIKGCLHDCDRVTYSVNKVSSPEVMYSQYTCADKPEEDTFFPCQYATQNHMQNMMLFNSTMTG